MDSLYSQRVNMVNSQLVARGIVDSNILEVMKDVPRHFFVPKKIQQYAYRDMPLSIGCSQTISQPYIVAPS